MKIRYLAVLAVVASAIPASSRAQTAVVCSTGATRVCTANLASGEECGGYQFCVDGTHWSECRKICEVPACGVQGSAAFGATCEEETECVSATVPPNYTGLQPVEFCGECQTGDEQSCNVFDGTETCTGVRVCRNGFWSDCGATCTVPVSTCDGVTNVPGHKSIGQACGAYEQCDPIDPTPLCLWKDDGSGILKPWWNPELEICLPGARKACKGAGSDKTTVSCSWKSKCSDPFNEACWEQVCITKTVPTSCDGFRICRPNGTWSECGTTCKTYDCAGEMIDGWQRFGAVCNNPSGVCVPEQDLHCGE